MPDTASPTREYRSRRRQQKGYDEQEDAQLIIWSQVYHFFHKFGRDNTYDVQNMHCIIRRRTERLVKRQIRKKTWSLRVDFMVNTLVRLGGFTLGFKSISYGSSLLGPPVEIDIEDRLE